MFTHQLPSVTLPSVPPGDPQRRANNSYSEGSSAGNRHVLIWADAGRGERAQRRRQNWTWLKSNQNNPPTTQTTGALCEWLSTKLMCSYRGGRWVETEREGVKGEFFQLGWHIYTIMCRIQSSYFFLSSTPQKLFFFFSPFFLLWC